MSETTPDKQTKPTYIMVPRKLIVAWLTSTIILFGMTLGSFQYTNYIDRRSNGYWCEIVILFDETYKQSPPATSTGKILAREFDTIRNGFRCD